MRTADFCMDMERKGVRSLAAAPLLFRGLWALGLKTAPPLYWDGMSVFFFYGIIFAVLGGGGTLLADTYIRHSVLPLGFYSACAAAGFLIGGGIVSAAVQQAQKRAAPLPPWSRYF